MPSLLSVNLFSIDQDSETLMILRWRRLFHSPSSLPFNPTKTPSSSKPTNPSHLQLSPSTVDSTIANHPSDSIALSFFLWCARQPNYFHPPHSFHRILPVVRRLSYRFKSVSAIIDELQSLGCPLKPQTFLIILRVYWQGNMFTFAHQVFEEMCKRGFVPNTFARNVILDTLFKDGQFDEAMRFFGQTRFPNFLSFNIVLRNLCERGDWMGARAVLREMVSRGYVLNIGTFTMILDCFKKERRISEVLQLLGFLILSGLCPSVEVWSILIDGLCRVGEIGQARNLMQKMLECGFSPTVLTYTSLIKGLFEAQMPDEVIGVWNLMLSKGCEPDLVLYNVLIDSFSKAGRYDVAIKVFIGLLQRKIKPDSYTVSSLLCVLCSSSKIHLLPKLISTLDFSVDIVVYNSLLNVLYKAGFPYQAVEIYKGMIAKGFTPDSYSYATILSSLCSLGWTQRAISFYYSIIAVNPNLDAYVHSAILDGLVKRGFYHTAIILFKKAVSENHCLDVISYTIVIHGLFKGGRFLEGSRLFEEMKMLGITPNTYTYNVMLSGLCRARDISAVKKLLKDMESDGIEMDSVTINTIMGLLVKLYSVGSGSGDLHLHLIHFMEDTMFVTSSGSDTGELLVCVGS